MEEENRERIRSEAHSKLILTGEHSVVYGYPAIAIPFPLKVSIDIWKETGEAKVISPIYTGALDKLPEEWRGLMEVLEEIYKYLHEPLRDVVIQIQSEVPQGRGLGSSAAVAMALVKGLFCFYKKKLDDQVLFHFVGMAESFAHGKPSGIDMMAVFYDTPIYFSKTKGVRSLISNNSTSLFHNPDFVRFSDLYLVVADSGIEGDTKQAVEKVRRRFEGKEENTRALISRIGKITLEIMEVMRYGNSKIIGKLMNENQECLKNLGVSNQVLDKLIEKALDAGALGAKLTGGGLGGCIIALTDSRNGAKKIMKELMKEGAKVSWYYSLENYEIIDSLTRLTKRVDLDVV